MTSLSFGQSVLKGNVINGAPNRRNVLNRLVVAIPALTTATSAAQAATIESIEGRLDANTLSMPPPSRASEFNGIGKKRHEC